MARPFFEIFGRKKTRAVAGFSERSGSVLQLLLCIRFAAIFTYELKETRQGFYMTTNR
jgi:hypothetical protein